MLEDLEHVSMNEEPVFKLRKHHWIRVVNASRIRQFTWFIAFLVTVLGGCDSHETETRDSDPIVENDSTLVVLRAECESARGLGSVTTLDSGTPFLIAAPHGTFDQHTAEIAESVCSSLGWNCVAARGYVVDGVRINVNRPTEGANLASANEIHSARAGCVYEYFLNQAQSVLNEAKTAFYVEIHGASSIQDVQIATVGIPFEQALRMKDILQSAWNAQNGSSRTINMEPVDTISFTARASKEIGMLSRYQPALHIELPRALRQDERTKVIQFLQNGLFTISLSEF